MGGYYWEKQLDKAYEQAAVLEKLVEKNDSFNEWFDNVCIALAKFYLKERALAKARFFLNKSLNLTAPPKAATWSARYETQYKVDSAEQNYRNAFFDLLTYKVFEDSVRNEIKSRQFQQLDVEYQTSKKEDSIFMLTQKNTLQTANLHQVQKIRDITIVGIVLALIIIGLLYRQYQVKQRNNKMMALKNEDLGRLVTEKEWLLQEVNHRVKNNLQTIVSLLELQPDTLSEDASLALQASQNRVFATSLLYQKLYKTENPSAVNMKVYLTELVDHLKDALGSSGKVNLILDIEPVEIDVSQGVSIGLIVNEVVTNSFKYAFDGTIEHPAIYISLAIHQGHAHLIIKDNGIGFSIAGEHGSGQGLKLVKGLSESISGRATFVSDNGASTQVSFLPKKPLGPMVHHYAS
jgi:two-component sensor histidine kinase